MGNQYYLKWIVFRKHINQRAATQQGGENLQDGNSQHKQAYASHPLWTEGAAVDNHQGERYDYAYYSRAYGSQYFFYHLNVLPTNCFLSSCLYLAVWAG